LKAVSPHDQMRDLFCTLRSRDRIIWIGCGWWSRQAFHADREVVRQFRRAACRCQQHPPRCCWIEGSA
jgi:hypothetical protein